MKQELTHRIETQEILYSIHNKQPGKEDAIDLLFLNSSQR